MKHLILFVCLLTVVGLFVVSCGKSKSGNGDYYAKGLDALDNKQSELAWHYLSLAVLEESNNYEANLQLGILCAREEGKYPLAVWYLHQARKLADNAEMRETAQMHLDQVQRKYYALLQENYSDQELQEAEMNAKLLAEQNKKLNEWISRLNRENFTLRQMLIERKGNN